MYKEVLEHLQILEEDDISVEKEIPSKQTVLERAFSSDVNRRLFLSLNTVTLPDLRQLNAISGDQSNKSQEFKKKYLWL